MIETSSETYGTRLNGEEFDAHRIRLFEEAEFGTDEAWGTVMNNIQNHARRQDAHDVITTYRLKQDAADQILIPDTSGALLQILKGRHKIHPVARLDKNPKELKTKANFAGGTRFVDPRSS